MMGDFEKWFEDQDFYTNMGFIHGDGLFIKDGDVYRVLPVQMAYVAFGEKHAEYAEAKQVGIALNTETINQRRYIASQQAKYEKLEIELSRTKQVLHNVIGMERAKVEKLKAEKEGFQNIIKSLRAEFDLNGGSDQVERQIELLEEAVRGDS